MDIEIIPDDTDDKLDYIIAMLEVLIGAGGLYTRVKHYMENPEGGPRQDEREQIYDDDGADTDVGGTSDVHPVGNIDKPNAD
jgi:hypothetical protein